MADRSRTPANHRPSQANGGCDFGEDPARTAHDARIIWDADVDPDVLQLCAVPAPKSGLVLKLPGARLDEAIGADGVRHLAIVSDHRRVRIDLAGGSLADGPVRLIVECADLATMHRASRILGRLEFLARTGAFPASLKKSEPRIVRHIQLLRVHDAITSGARPREIALGLFGQDMLADGWAGDSDYVKSRTRRLIADARAMSKGSWRSLMSKTS